MKTLLINGISKVNEQGVLLHFNKKVTLNGGLSADEWWVSWDKIGKVLLPDKYCELSEVAERNKLRGSIAMIKQSTDIDFAAISKEEDLII